MVNCVYLSEDPIAQDTYKSPDIRYVCRCADRLKDMRQYSDRFVGGENDCATCPYRIENSKI